MTALVRSAVHILPRWAMNLPLLGIRPYAASRHLPLWVSDLGAALLQKLLYGDLEAHGLRLQTERGLKSELHLRHRAPLIDIGTIDLVRSGALRLVDAEIEALTAGGVVFVGGAAEPFDVIVLATGYDQAQAPHAAFLPAALIEGSLGAHGFLESGVSAAAPTLFFAGMSDHSGRLAEIYHESAAIVDALARLVVPFDRTRRRGELPPAVSRQAVAALPPACVVEPTSKPA